MDRTALRAFAGGVAPLYASEDDPALVARAQGLLDEAERWWRAFGPRRQSYREGRDGMRGRHYEGAVVGPDGRALSKREYLASVGRKADVFNLVEPVVRQMVGAFRQNKSERDVFPTDGGHDPEAVEMMNAARRAMRREAASAVIEADNYLTHLIGGWSVFRSGIERAHSGPFSSVVVDDVVHPTRAFYNLDVDRRMRGLRIVGELLDVTPEDLVARYARTPAEAARLLGLYGLPATAAENMGSGGAAGGYGGQSGGAYADSRSQAVRGAGRYGFHEHDSVAFRTTNRSGLLRVICVWAQGYEWQQMATDPLAFDPAAQAAGLPTLPQGDGPLPPALQAPGALQMENVARQMMGLPPIEARGPEYAPVWRYYYLTPEGRVLRTGVSGYWHGGPPYTVSQALSMDGETWGVVDGLMDPQRWFNARLSDLDHAIRTGTKSTLFVDKKAREESGLTSQQLNEALARGDGAVDFDFKQQDPRKMIYEHTPGQMPPGVFEVIQMMPGLVERISGVSAAAQGQTPNAGTTATQFERQVLQSSVMIQVYPDTYFEALTGKDRREVRMLQQALDTPQAFYDLRAGETREYDPARARALRLDVATGAAADTPTSKLADEQMLREDALNGWISPKTYYGRSGRPDAAGLLRDIQQEEAEALQMQLAAMQALPPGAAAAPQDGAPAPL